MSALEPIRTNNSARRTRSRSQSAPSASSNRQPRLSRVFSAQHLDDHSHYHGHDERHGQQLEATSSEESDYTEKVEREEEKELGGNTGEESTEIREGIVNERDVEAPLERIKSTRSVKDPNLVSMSQLQRMVVLILA